MGGFIPKKVKGSYCFKRHGKVHVRKDRLNLNKRKFNGTKCGYKWRVCFKWFSKNPLSKKIE